MFTFSMTMPYPLCEGSVDVNLTPDKRAVMVQQEKALLILVKVNHYTTVIVA